MVEQGLPHEITAAEQGLSQSVSTIEHGLISSHDNGVMDKDIQCLEGVGEYLPDCGSPASSIDSKHENDTNIASLALECVHAILYVDRNFTSRRILA